MRLNLFLLIFLFLISCRLVWPADGDNEEPADKETSEDGTEKSSSTESEEDSSPDNAGSEEGDCESQAKQGECHRSLDLWNTCTPNCVMHTKDHWKHCQSLAENERCMARSTEMRQEMHMNCPQSCGYAIAWNFKHREFMKLDKFASMDASLGEEPCAPPRGVLAAADIMRERLLLYIAGGADVVRGMNYAWIPDVSVFQMYTYTCQLYVVSDYFVRFLVILSLINSILYISLLGFLGYVWNMRSIAVYATPVRCGIPPSQEALWSRP